MNADDIFNELMNFKVYKTKHYHDIGYVLPKGMLVQGHKLYLYKPIDTEWLIDSFKKCICYFQTRRYISCYDGHKRVKLYLTIFDSKEQVLRSIPKTHNQILYSNKNIYFSNLSKLNINMSFSLHHKGRYICDLYRSIYTNDTKLKSINRNILFKNDGITDFILFGDNTYLSLPRLRDMMNMYKSHGISQFESIDEVKAAYAEAKKQMYQSPPIEFLHQRKHKVPYHCIKYFKLMLIKEVLLGLGLVDLSKDIFYFVFMEQVKDVIRGTLRVWPNLKGYRDS